MKINFAAVITDAKGEPIPVADRNGEPTEEKTTLRHLAEQAMLGPAKGDDALPTTEKVKHYKLFNKISDGADDLTAEEVVLLKERIGLVFTTLAVGRCYDIIDKAEKGEG